MKISNPPAYRFLTVLAAVLVLLTGLPVKTQANTQMKFIGVNLGDDKSLRADAKLVNYLSKTAKLEITNEQQTEYGTMISMLVDPKNEHYLARVTPYVYVVAAMRGAEFEVLATYKNQSNSTRYQSYFVVNRDDFKDIIKDNQSRLTLDHVFEKLKLQQPRTFVYHDKFSTSSYFVPALEFRRRNIFSIAGSTMNTSDGTLTAIRSERIDNTDKPSSSDLVKAVANKEAFIAAVWDGTRNRFVGDPKNNIAADVELKQYADKVYFIEIPTELPNDLLVCSKNVDAPTQKALRTAIKEMPDKYIDIGDFKTWIDIDSERDAKVALAGLRHDAEQRAAQVTVSIDNSKTSPVKPEWVESIKHAIRLSGTELVPYDGDYHGKADFRWTVEQVHDKAINLTSEVGYLPSQNIQMSFTDTEDLTKRIGGFIHSRMHRIRYIWPYNDESPTVIRDAVFPISSETEVKVVKVTWTNPQKNHFDNGRVFDATVDVDKTTPFSFQLKGLEFLKTQNGDYAFDPMSNVSYRVFLARPEREGRMFTLLTYLFLGLLLLAAAGALWDMRRKKIARELPILNLEDFKQKCRELADTSRSFWREHKLRDADVVWCSRKSLDELVADLKANTGNVDFDSRRIRKRSLAILAHIPVVSKFLNLQAGAGLERIDEIDPAKFGNTQRLGDTIHYLMNQKAFSPFTGERLEWDALDEMTADVFKPFRIEEAHLNGNGNGNCNGNGHGQTEKPRRATRRTTRRTTINSRKRTPLVAKNGIDTLIRSEHPMVLSAVAKHFNEVIEQSKAGVCFFGKNWAVKKTKTEMLLAYSAPLQSPLQLNGTKTTISKLTLQVQVPRSAETDELARSKEVHAWVLGKLVDVGRNGSARTLVLNFKPTALVRTDDPE